MHFFSSVKEELLVLKVPLLLVVISFLTLFLFSFSFGPGVFFAMYPVFLVVYLLAGAVAYQKTGRMMDGVFASFLFGLLPPLLSNRVYLGYVQVHLFAGSYLVSILVSVFLGAIGAQVMKEHLKGRKI